MINFKNFSFFIFSLIVIPSSTLKSSPLDKYNEKFKIPCTYENANYRATAEYHELVGLDYPSLNICYERSEEDYLETKYGDIYVISKRYKYENQKPIGNTWKPHVQRYGSNYVHKEFAIEHPFSTLAMYACQSDIKGTCIGESYRVEIGRSNLFGDHMFDK